jgi:hypothetical protein
MADWYRVCDELAERRLRPSGNWPPRDRVGHSAEAVTPGKTHGGLDPCLDPVQGLYTAGQAGDEQSALRDKVTAALPSRVGRGARGGADLRPAPRAPEQNLRSAPRAPVRPEPHPGHGAWVTQTHHFW